MKFGARIIAVHEAGHAIGSFLTPARRVEKVSINPDPEIEGNLGSSRAGFRKDYKELHGANDPQLWTGKEWFRAVSYSPVLSLLRRLESC